MLDIKKHYVIKNHTLHRCVGDDLRLVIPKDARWQVCKANHDEVGHFGFAKTLERIQSRYWFPKLRRFVKKYVAACIDCAYNKDNAARTRTGLLHPIEKTEEPFNTLHLDHLGPFVKSKSQKSYILLVDGFTKYLFARPVRDTKTKNVIKALDHLFNDFGVPRRIITDRGTAFTSSQFKDFCTGKGIKHVLNAVACPRANGQAERFNQTILTALSAQSHGKDERIWDEQLGKVQCGINNTINASTKKSPAELLFGVKLNGPIDNKLSTEDLSHASVDVPLPDQVLAHNTTSNVDSVDVPSPDQVLAHNTASTGDLSTSDSIGLSLPDQTLVDRTALSVDNEPVIEDSTFPEQTMQVDSNDSLDAEPVLIATNDSHVQSEIETLRKEASENIKRSQERQKEAYDLKRLPVVVYSLGDLVKITKTNFKNDGKSKKLLPKFIGPFKVTKCLGNCTI